MISLLYIDFLVFLATIFTFQSAEVPLDSSCLDCHGDIAGREIIHPAIDDACDNCHQSTGENHPQEGVEGFSLIDKTPQLCFYCHEELIGMEVVHYPVGEGDCLACHDVHSSEEERLLTKKLPDLCISCHSREYVTDSSKTANIGRQLARSHSRHEPLADGECVICHLPHESDYSALLIDYYPEEEYVAATADNFAICFLCHDSQIIEEEKTEWGTNFRNGDQNLHYLHINGSKGRNCNLCHNVHAAPGDFLIEDYVTFGNWKMKMNFVPSENGGSCLPGCHGVETYDRAKIELPG